MSVASVTIVAHSVHPALQRAPAPPPVQVRLIQEDTRPVQVTSGPSSRGSAGLLDTTV